MNIFSNSLIGMPKYNATKPACHCKDFAESWAWDLKQSAHALAAATEADRFGGLRPLREASLGFGRQGRQACYSHVTHVDLMFPVHTVFK